jgi:lytic murein transglycosylase
MSRKQQGSQAERPGPPTPGSYTRPMRHRLRAACISTLLVLGTSLAAASPSLPLCIEQLRRELPQHPKLRPESFDQLLAGVQDLRAPIDSAAQSQPEFQLPIWDYLARLVDEQRVRDGRRVLDQDQAALAQVAATHRVDPATVVAIFGIESDFGRLTGRYPVLDATLSRACLNLANRERKAHFFAALWLLQEGQVQREAFRGSWAGAFGMTQFMPGTHVRYQADGDGDGQVDTVRSRADALATTANYLKSLGWVEGLPWGVEVNAPRDLARGWSSAQTEHACLASAEAQGRCRRLAQWAALGVVRADGQALTSVSQAWPEASAATPWALLTPAGPNGPAWLVSRNFQAVWQYNRADSYALAIGLLSAALRQEPPLQATWPTQDAQTALSRNGTAALQQLLVTAGHCQLAVDGYDGPMTRQAIRDEERRRGLPDTGRPSTTLLERLRAEPPATNAPCEREQPAVPAVPSTVPAPAEPASGPLSPAAAL